MRKRWLLAAFLLGLAVRPSAAQFIVLHRHAPDPGYASTPPVVDPAGNVYAASWWASTVFAMPSGGTGVRVLAGVPSGPLLLAGATLYATTLGGYQTTSLLFALSLDGTGYRVLHTFAGGPADGDESGSPLALDASGRLYGTTTGGGALGHGVVFSVNLDGTDYRVFHSFSAEDGIVSWLRPGVAVDDGGNVYGTTPGGGSYDGGTVYTMRTDGSGYAVVPSFATDDGAQPRELVFASGRLYGATEAGGPTGAGVLFRVKTDGSEFAVLRAGSCRGLIVNGGHLFGVTPDSAFRMNLDGSDYVDLHVFAGGPSDGSWPTGLALDPSGALVGLTMRGGGCDAGVMFRSNGDGSEYAIVREMPGACGDGDTPMAGLVADDVGYLYGTVGGSFAPPLSYYVGPPPDGGAVFRMRADGSEYEVLHSFLFSSEYTPYGSLALDRSGWAYGTTRFPGGIVFRIRTDGTDYAVLHRSTTESEGSQSYSGLLLDGSGNLYGTMSRGGGSQAGVVFTLRTDGTGYRVLHAFAGGAADGMSPYGPLVFGPAGKLFGTTTNGGPSDQGVVFSMNPDGSEFAILHAFDWTNGAGPQAALAFGRDEFLYGTAPFGGAANAGVVFRIKPDGSEYTVLHTFAGGATDGAYPIGGLVLDTAVNLHGTAFRGGPSDKGVLFSMRSDGSGYVIRHFFGGPEGSYPRGTLLPDGAGNLYGTTAGPWGTEFRFDAFPAGPLAFYTLTPCRALDTRAGGAPLAAGEERAFSLANACGIPAGAVEVAANVTVADPSADGSVRALPVFGSSALQVSFHARQVRATSGILGLTRDAAQLLPVRNESAGTVHVIVDVFGYFR